MFLRGERSLHTIAAKLFPSSYDIGNNHFHCKATESVELINLIACMYVWNGK